MQELDLFYLNKEEPVKGCLLFLRKFIPQLYSGIQEKYKYRLPFFYFQNKMFCYLWIDKKDGFPYIGVVDGLLIEHPALEKGDRKRMKILKFDPNEEVPVDDIREVLMQSIALRLKL